MEGDMSQSSSGGSKAWIWVVVAIAVIGIGIYLWMKNKKPATKNNGQQDGSGSPGGSTVASPQTAGTAKKAATHSTAASAPSSSDTLQVNSKGDDVKKLQEYLIGKGAKITADGNFGPKTKAAVLNAGMSYPVKKSEYGSLWDVYSSSVIKEANDTVTGLGKIVDGAETVLAAPLHVVGNVASTIWDDIKSI